MANWIGYAASILVAVSITLKGGLIFRVLNLTGSACFFIYGLMISSLPVILINIYAIGINIFYVTKILIDKNKEKQLNKVK